MKRALTAILLLAALVFGAGMLFWYFAYGADAPPPFERQVAGLSRPATIRWQRNDIVHIEAQSARDAAAALGYAHGTQRCWTVALWRQTALGRLAEWFGRDLLPFDRHARRIGFGRLAQQAFAQLPDSTRQRLTAYAEGMNAALDDDAVQRHDELVLFDVTPARWEAWHVLAIERLMAWIATPPLADSTLAATDSATARFFATDVRFRQWLHLYGFDRSVAWVVHDDQDRPRLFQRHAYGASALPLFQEVTITHRGAPGTSGASLPGTPFFPAGRAGDHAWSVFLSSPLDLVFAPVDSAALTTTYERIGVRDGGEVLLKATHTPDGLPLGHPSSAPLALETLPDSLSPRDSAAAVDSMRTRRRSVWQIRWPGFQAVTDAAAWHALTEGRATDFRLLDGRGLYAAADGEMRVLGTPDVVERFDGGVIVGQTDWVHTQASLLQTQQATASPTPLTALSANDSSAWAAERASALVPFLQSPSPSASRFEEAATYLRNWDFIYDHASIGASIFDAWLRAYRAETDTLPSPPDYSQLVPPADSLTRVQWRDSLRTDSLHQARRLQQTFRRAVDSLTATFGPDTRHWRWERVSTALRYFPVWSADSLIDPARRDLSHSRFAPLERSGRGHPSTLAGGTSLLDTPPPIAATWEGWASLASPTHFMVRRHRPHTDVFLGRHAASDGRPAPFPLRTDDDPLRTTMLRPAP